MTQEELKKDGWKIDTSVYPNIAHRGKRSAPMVVMEIPTEKERVLQEEVLSLRMEITRLNLQLRRTS